MISSHAPKTSSRIREFESGALLFEDRAEGSPALQTMPCGKPAEMQSDAASRDRRLASPCFAFDGSLPDLHGDFQSGFANHAALQGSQPVLLVVKKNGAVLRRLLRWLDDAPVDVRRTLPFLLIDDEADQASVDTRGSYQGEDDPPDSDYEPPSVINGLIRDLLRRFERRA